MGRKGSYWGLAPLEATTHLAFEFGEGNFIFIVLHVHVPLMYD